MGQATPIGFLAGVTSEQPRARRHQVEFKCYLHAFAVERNEWMQALQQAVVEHRAHIRLSSASVLGVRGGTEQPDHAGSLELRGFKNKLYVAVAGDKVQLYKNLEV